LWYDIEKVFSPDGRKERKYMLIDMHAHTSGISRCCRAEAREILETARKNGIDGLILCNHYQECYVEADGAAAFAQRYIAEYEKTKAIADEMGMPLYFGVEVTAKLHDNAHILLYGMTPDILREHPEIYAYPLEKMYALVHERGGLVIQAHPFRGGGQIQDMAYLDGVEVNCHPLYDATHCARLMKIAEENDLLVTCGGDYHADCYRAVCGTHFPDGKTEYADLMDYLKHTLEICLLVHELRTEKPVEVTFAVPGR